MDTHLPGVPYSYQVTVRSQPYLEVTQGGGHPANFIVGLPSIPREIVKGSQSRLGRSSLPTDRLTADSQFGAVRDVVNTRRCLQFICTIKGRLHRIQERHHKPINRISRSGGHIITVNTHRDVRLVTINNRRVPFTDKSNNTIIPRNSRLLMRHMRKVQVIRFLNHISFRVVQISTSP